MPKYETPFHSNREAAGYISGVRDVGDGLGCRAVWT